VEIVLPLGNMAPLTQTLSIAAEFGMHIHSLLSMTLADGAPHIATLRMRTINPAPLLRRLRRAGIECASTNPLDEAPGYCVYNAAVIAIAHLLQVSQARVLYIDFDAHHGNGVQRAFYDDPRVMTVSFHETGRSLFPGRGDILEIG
jgi:hypothetical protein